MKIKYKLYYYKVVLLKKISKIGVRHFVNKRLKSKASHKLQGLRKTVNNYIVKNLIKFPCVIALNLKMIKIQAGSHYFVILWK